MNRHIFLQGDAWKLAKTLPSGSVHCIVTSPPYWALRDYGTAQWDGGDPDCQHRVGNQVQDNKWEGAIVSGIRPGADASTCQVCGAKRVDEQFGLEAAPQEYVAKLVDLFRELRRVLRDDGTVWLNLGSSYMGSGGAGGWSKRKAGEQEYVGPRGDNPNRNGEGTGFKPKDLVPIPWMAALALQADGWWLRSDIIWAKSNVMPSSVRDRPTTAHEYIFLFSKSRHYYYDAEAIKEPLAEGSAERYAYSFGGTKNEHLKATDNPTAVVGQREPTTGRNKRTVWEIPTRAYKGAHFATFPPALVEPMILAGTSEVGCCPECGAPWQRIVERTAERVNLKEGERQQVRNAGVQGGGTESVTLGVTDSVHRKTVAWQPTCPHGHDPVPCVVLDPFMGSGTTAEVAIRHGRDAVGFELNADYIALAEERLEKVRLEMGTLIPPLEKQLDELPLFKKEREK